MEQAPDPVAEALEAMSLPDKPMLLTDKPMQQPNKLV